MTQRSRWIPIAVALAVSLTASAEPARVAQAPAATSYAFVHGRWFDGTSFVAETFYAVSGALTRRRPARIDRTIDLAGGFVVPPFADAHTHHFDGPATRDQVAMYLRDGVFYAKVQTDVRTSALRVASEVNRPDSVDVSYAHGALTSSYGHGVEIYEGIALGLYRYPMPDGAVAKIRASHRLENDAYYVIDTAADLAAKWPTIAAGRPDFLKLYLLTSEDHAARVARTDTVGDRGVDPKLVPEIVARGHAAGLRVSAHVDTVADYRVALAGGVDEMAHLPGYRFEPSEADERYLLSDADAAETARRGVWVIVAPVVSEGPPPDLQHRIDAVRAQNLGRLARAGAHLAFGSDWYGTTPVPAVRYLARTGVFSRVELLRIWCEQTPRTIFPTRKLGRLADGYEASFLVLAANPLDDFDAVTRIRLRFKQGQLLTVAAK